jgi:biotin transport system permease protein
MISLYRPGTSVVHRLPAGWKLLALAAAVTLFSVCGKTLVGSASALVVTVAAYLLAGIGFQEFGKQLWQLKVLFLIILIPQLLFNGYETGSYNTVTLVSGVLLAALVSLTTKTTDIVELIKRITRSQNFALLIALSINSIALVIGFSKNISEAGLARGVKPNPIRQIVTLFVVSLRYADDYAEALAARGVVV